MHKYGFHIHAIGDRVFDAIVRIKPKVIKTLHHDVGFWQRVRQAHPTAFIIGRLYSADQEFRSNPAELGRAFAERILREEVNRATFQGHPLYDAWESFNEVMPESVGGDMLDAYDSFQVAFGHRMQQAGFEPVAMNFATGNFRGQQFLDHFPGTLETYKYIGFHEYDWPRLDRLHRIGLSKGDDAKSIKDRLPSIGANTGDGGMWLCLRYRRTMNEGVRQKYGNKHICIITECGMTQGVQQGQDIGPWSGRNTLPRSYPDSSVRCPIPLDDYWQSLLWYHGELLNDDYVLGACLFTVGAISPWESFEHLGDVVDRLEKWQPPSQASAAGTISGAAIPVVSLTDTLLAAGKAHQAIQLNPQAALQKRILADGLVPNSPEFEVEVSGVHYIGQQAEHLGTGNVRVYYVRVGDWANVRFVERP
jgi:hypothetical protein